MGRRGDICGVDIDRHFFTHLLWEPDFARNKVLLLVGARRVGKTTGLRRFAEAFVGGRRDELLWLNGEDQNTHTLLAPRTAADYRRLLEGRRLFVLDEGQAVPEVGAVLKLMHDEVPGVWIIVTGSNAIGLLDSAGGPLVGRAVIRELYPVAQLELAHHEDALQTIENRKDRLVYGSYPELFQLSSAKQRRDYLLDLVRGVLLRDVLELAQVRRPEVLRRLLVLLAWQVCNEVSVHELAQNLDVDAKTVSRYLELIEQAFIVFSLNGYQGNNQRKEIKKSRKFYFADNGIRNAVINRFEPYDEREGGERGRLWENYLATERRKRNGYLDPHRSHYFWRVTDSQQEIDWVEEVGGRLYGYEFKLAARKTKPPSAWYPEAEFEVITPENYLPFIGG